VPRESTTLNSLPSVPQSTRSPSPPFKNILTPSSTEPHPTVAAVSVSSVSSSSTAASETSENAPCSPETPRDSDLDQLRLLWVINSISYFSYKIRFLENFFILL